MLKIRIFIYYISCYFQWIYLLFECFSIILYSIYNLGEDFLNNLRVILLVFTLRLNFIGFILFYIFDSEDSVCYGLGIEVFFNENNFEFVINLFLIVMILEYLLHRSYEFDIYNFPRNFCWFLFFFLQIGLSFIFKLILWLYFKQQYNQVIWCFLIKTLLLPWRNSMDWKLFTTLQNNARAFG